MKETSHVTFNKAGEVITHTNTEADEHHVHNESDDFEPAKNLDNIYETHNISDIVNPANAAEPITTLISPSAEISHDTPAPQVQKPSQDFTRSLGSPIGLKGLLHTINATVIPTKSCASMVTSCKEAFKAGLVGCHTSDDDELLESWMLLEEADLEHGLEHDVSSSY
ncbi:hypothetical protein Tco_0756470 [Tanacetum coccineum]